MNIQFQIHRQIRTFGKFIAATMLMSAGVYVTALGRQVTAPQALQSTSLQTLTPAIAYLLPPIRSTQISPPPAIARFLPQLNGIYASTGFLDACGGMLVILGSIGLKEVALDSQE